MYEVKSRVDCQKYDECRLLTFPLWYKHFASKLVQSAEV